MNEQVKVQKCTCKNEYQDRRYGLGMRVHNKCLKPVGGYRCTVCGAKN